MFTIQEVIKKTYNENFIRIEYACLNGAYHDYSCCQSCWNNHPRHIEGTDFRVENQILYSKKYGGQGAMAERMAEMEKEIS